MELRKMILGVALGISMAFVGMYARPTDPIAGPIVAVLSLGYSGISIKTWHDRL